MRQFNFLLIFFLFCQISYASEQTSKTGISSGLPIPRFVSLKSNKVKQRIGPGKKYKTQFVYTLKNLPVKIVAEFDNWRKITDIDGAEGWIHSSMLSGNRYVIMKNNNFFLKKELSGHIQKNQALLFNSDTEKSFPVAKVELGAILKLKKCKDIWCKIEAKNISGWARKENLYGVD